jgi:hypothetical protein
MIPLRQTVRLFLVVILTAFLGSCIDCREEIWLKADGSGRAHLTYELPATAAALHGGESGIREMIMDFLKRTPEITSSECEVTTEGDRVRVGVQVGFKSALALKDALAGDSLNSLPGAASHLAGEVSADLRGRTLEFSRSITPGKVLPGSAFLPGPKLAGHRLTYIMHLPVAAEESNATRVENSGRTLIWDLPLSQAVKAPVLTRFRMQVPIPWTLVAAIAVPLCLATGFVLIRFRRSRTGQSS